MGRGTMIGWQISSYGVIGLDLKEADERVVAYDALMDVFRGASQCL